MAVKSGNELEARMRMYDSITDLVVRINNIVTMLFDQYMADQKKGK